MTNNANHALRGLLDALVSPDCTDAELPAVFTNVAGGGDIVPAIIAARKALAAEQETRTRLNEGYAEYCAECRWQGLPPEPFSRWAEGDYYDPREAAQERASALWENDTWDLY
jgi:hypothetical protein